MATPSKDPKDLKIAYPRHRAPYGLKSAITRKARTNGLKSFTWHCPIHGITAFNTSGSCNCRACLADAAKARRKGLKAIKPSSAALAVRIAATPAPKNQSVDYAALVRAADTLIADAQRIVDAGGKA